MNGKIYLKQQLLKDTFAAKRYVKELLVHMKEEKVYKILTNKKFTDETDCPFNGGQYIVEIWWNSQEIWQCALKM